MLTMTFPRLTIMALACLLGPALARAQDASVWDKQRNSEARLIAGATVKTANFPYLGAPIEPYLRAGIELQLDPGWKTYWRYPGDSGVPPTFDFSGSDNVKSVTVEWPAPQRFPDGAGGNSIGYVGRIILPLRVFQNNAAKATSLHLKLGYDVCGNLCVPADANLTLALSGDGAEENAIEKDAAR